MRQWRSEEFEDVKFGHDVEIVGEDVRILPGALIGDRVSIHARTIFIGSGSSIEHETRVCGLSGSMQLFNLGDQSLIGFRNQILCPHFTMGDYSQLHNSGLHSGYEPLAIGHNCWIGQNSILNCTKNLRIGNNVRIGTQSQLWTHVASGELLEGCTLFGEYPLILEDDVWIVGGAVISPGLTLAEKSIIMTGAVLTKSTKPRHTYAGVPASDVTAKLSFWREVSHSDRRAMAQQFIEEFLEASPRHRGSVVLASSFEDLANAPSGSIVIVDELRTIGHRNDISIFDLSTKRYQKLRTQIEVDFIKYNVGHRMRFTPFEAELE